METFRQGLKVLKSISADKINNPYMATIELNHVILVNSFLINIFFVRKLIN